MTMVTKLVSWTLGATLCLAGVSYGQATPAKRSAPPTQQEVDKAVDRAIKALYERHKPDLMWENQPYAKRDPKQRWGVNDGQWGGQTSIVTYALLAAGEDPGQNPKLQASIDGLAQANLNGVYAIGMRAQVWLNLPRRPEYQQAMAREYDLLVEAIQGNDVAKRSSLGANKDRSVGLFDYLLEETTRVDLSVTQYGVLGFWAAAQYGAQVPPGFWKEMEDGWIRWQQENGMWAYGGNPNEKHPGSVALTTAGVASLFITNDYLRSTVNCNGNQINPAIVRGLDFIARHMPMLLGFEKAPNDVVKRQANVEAHTLYTLYGIERIGVASGRKYIGGIDWYAEGARYLLKKQNSNGTWGSPYDTAFAILFLVNGRQPPAVTKLAYADDANQRRSAWNQRSRDAANLAAYIEFTDERKVNWQTYQFGSNDNVDDVVKELHDSPLAYLAAGGELALRPDDMEALKRYIDTGGLLLINADCNDRGVANQARKLGDELFGDRGYEWRRLPDDHPIYRTQKFNLQDVRRKPELLGLSNGVRELIVIAPDDPARAWQLRDVSKEGPMELGVNLYLYGVGNLPQAPRGVIPLVDKNDAVKTTRDVRVGRIKYDGNWNPEPAGWDRLAAVMHNEHKANLTVAEVDPMAASLAEYDVLHLTGADTFNLPEGAADKLKAYVEAGGTLLVDAAGGNAAFIDSAEKLLRSAFAAEANSLSEPLPTSHPVYNAAGEPINDVGFTLFARRTVGGANKPRLRGISFENRLGVIFSHEDLTNGLVGSNVGGVMGYAPEDATRLTAAALLHAADRRK